MGFRNFHAPMAALLLVLAAAPAHPQTRDSVAGGKFVIEPATLTAIGVEWTITDDANRNAAVSVSFRKVGENAWRPALPLMRLKNEIVNSFMPVFQHREPSPTNPHGSRESPWHYDVGNKFAGSILNLDADTEYECRFLLSDPDGVDGEKEKTIRLRTRAEPKAVAGGKIYHVYPIGWTGPKQQPAYTGLVRAYYRGASSSDHGGTFPPRVLPGDTILVHAGTYVSDRFHYLVGVPHPGFNALASVIDGTYYLTQRGTADKPITIKGAGDGEVIFDGAGNQNLFNVLRADYNYFEGITVRNTTIAFLAGWKDIAGVNGFTLKNSRIYDVGRVVQAEWSGARNFYIADNVMIGRQDPVKMMGWNNGVWTKFPGFPELLLSDYAVKLYGQGHVVAYNYVANFHDGADVSTYGEPDGTANIERDAVTGPTQQDDRIAAAIDFYGNDFFNMGDNCVETDGGVHNIRVFNNRCVNTAEMGLSAAPLFGGPAYFYRNLVYNAPQAGPLKFTETPAGVLVYQNTFVAGDTAPSGPAANLDLRNNIFLGRGDPAKPVYTINTTTNYSRSDYNGFSLNGGAADFVWNSPPANVQADFDHTHPLTVRRFKTLKEFSRATGQDSHSVILGQNTLVHAPMADNSDPQRLYNPEDMDFRLRPGSPAVDAGTVLATINDGHAGRAPDLGAYELGQPVPQYGPRNWPLGDVLADKLGFRSWRGPPR